MTEEERLDCRYQLAYKADHSARYHRRRSSFLRAIDLLITLLVAISGATAFGDLKDGAPSLVSMVATAVITALSLTQAIAQFGRKSAEHSGWLARWNQLAAAIETTPKPSKRDVEDWLKEKSAIESECVSELRALAIDTENRSARYFSLEGRFRRINWWQRLIIQLGTLQQSFPRVPDDEF